MQREKSHIYFYSLKDADLTHAWETIAWKRAKEHLREMQLELAKAAKNHDGEQIKRVQFRIVTSLDAKLLAVENVTAAKGHAGIDHVKWETPNEKIHAALSLTSMGYNARPALAVERRDKKGNLRRFNVDTYYDRAMQALYAYSLAPVQETWSDRKSFANRRGRGTMDANYFVTKIFSGKDAPLWAVKTDVKKCYESLEHDWIRENIPLAGHVKNEFLRAGYFLSDKYYASDHGIGIGCRLSPYIANMSMDGLQDYLYSRLNSGRKVKDYNNGNMVRFADDILVSARNRETAILIRQYIRDFLSERGLLLSDEKTEILYVPQGFDYLKRHYRKEGERLVASPSEAAVAKFKNDIGSFILSSNGSPEGIVEEVNHRIAWFATNHKMTDAWDAFRDIDAHICACLLELCEMRYGRDRRDQFMRDYWFFDHQKRPVFMVKGAPHKHVLLMQDTIPTTYQPLSLKLNPYIDFEEIDRIMGSRKMKNVVGQYRMIWERQGGRCEYCRGQIYPNDEKELVEVDPTAGRFTDRMAYIHGRCKDTLFESDGDGSDYTGARSSMGLLLELSDKYRLKDLAGNPLYQYFRDSKKRTETLSFNQIGEMLGMDLDEAAGYREFWVQDAEDSICRCWLDNGYYFIKLNTKKRRTVTFRKLTFAGETARVELPDIIVHGKLPVRTAYKINAAIQSILEQGGLPTV